MHPLRIAIDASRTTVARVTGTERYALELIRAMIRLNTEHQLLLYFRNHPPPDLLPTSDRITISIIPFRRMWTHIRFAATLWRDRPDVTFVPAHTLPFLFPGRAIVTVHDLGYRHFPRAHPAFQRMYLNLTTRYSANRATLVFADSQATANDLHRFYGTRHDKIRVIYPGIERPHFHDVDIAEKYCLPERYFLFIGTLQPRKNIAGLVRAYRSYRERVDQPAGLVLAGGKGWLYDDRWIAGTDGVQLIGYIDEEDKAALFANAIALVFPSLYEGFGFPVLEAMHCGLPVIASNTSSLPELVGEAGLTVDPDDFFAIASAMVHIDRDYDLREALRDRGYAQARRFTWDRAAANVFSAIETLPQA
ncbi:MAG: glycosyltransferase family 4 protein [Chloroflexota bacterium]